MHIEMNSGCIFSNHFNVEVIFEKIVVDGISARPIRAKAQKLTVQCNLIKKKKSYRIHKCSLSLLAAPQCREECRTGG